MLNFTVDKTKTMYAAIHTHTGTASAKYKTSHSTQHYCVPLQESWKLYQLPLYILFRMPPSSFRLGLLRKFLLRRACSMPSTQTFLTEECITWSSSTATLSCPAILSGKKPKLHINLVSPASTSGSFCSGYMHTKYVFTSSLCPCLPWQKGMGC